MNDSLNPANEPGKTDAERKRTPMTLPMRKLEVSEIAGYHLYWMRGSPQRLAQAERAGYEFVTEDDVKLNNLDLGGDAAVSGNTDMGSKVSTVTGDDLVEGQPMRLYLMKIREEWWQEGQKILEDRSEKIADSFRRGLIGHDQPGAGDTSNRYTKGKVPDLFKLKRRS